MLQSKLLLTLGLAACCLTSARARANTPRPAAPPLAKLDVAPQLETYAEIAYRVYGDAYRAARALQSAVKLLLKERDQAALTAARRAWLAARPSYGQSEAFRFYGGPIDAGSRGHAQRVVGLEGYLNAWPLNEAVIDGVRGRPEAGIIHTAVPITRSLLLRENERQDEADVTTGYHAIEFLLWGQDFDPAGPGARSAQDFVGDGVAARRRQYLWVATGLLVEHLKSLVDAWAPGRKNYRALLLRAAPETGVKNMLVGIATLSGFELASERLGTALDSGTQEDEQSCFSDSTHLDVLANAIGIQNVYLGKYADFRGAGLNALVAAVNPDLNRYLEKHLSDTVKKAAELKAPFDQTLAAAPDSARRREAEALVKAFQMQADLLKQAASALGVPIALGDND